MSMLIRNTGYRQSGRSGSVAVTVMVAAVGILAVAALVVDLGMVALSAQRCQNVADAGALAGGQLLSTSSAAIAGAQDAVAANNVNQHGLTVNCNYVAGSQTSDVRYFGPGEAVPGVGTLGAGGRALLVRCRINVNFTFARVVGLTTRAVARQAIVVRAPITGASICPMWVSAATPYNFGVSQELYNTDNPSIAGNFGWLDLPAGVTADWNDCLADVPLSEADLQGMSAEPGDIWTGAPGGKVGQWMADLQARLAKATGEPWTTDTFEVHRADNPHIMIVPLVTFGGYSGTNAQYRIERFGAFWLDTVNHRGTTKDITGRFLQYVMPGADMDIHADDTGVYAVKMVS
jgi:hypothetical protein